MTGADRRKNVAWLVLRGRVPPAARVRLPVALSAGVRICGLVLSLAVIAPARAAEPATRPAGPFTGAFIHLSQLFEKDADADVCRKALAETLDRFRQSGLRVAMPYVTTTSGMAVYDSDIIPDRQYKDWDPFAAFLAEARKRDIEVWPVFCVVSCGDADVRGILRKHEEWALLDKSERKIGWISPCNPQARAWLASVVTEIVTKYKPDGIVLDYLRFPNQPVAFDADSAARFAKEHPNHKSLAEAERKAQVQEFKEKSLTDLARLLSQEARRQKPGIRVGMYTWGPHVTKSHYVAQMWPEWLARGYVDMVSVSGYCFRENYGEKYLEVFEKRMKDAVQLAGGLRPQAELTFTLGVRTSHGRVARAEAINDYLKAARKAGIRGVAVFTWTYLQPFLDDVIQAGYLRTFTAPGGERNPAPAAPPHRRARQG